MDDLVERVARAIVDENHRINPVVALWVDQPEIGRFTARATARAAIEAMRAPTKAMIEAGADGVMNDQLVKLVWHKMIDEALGPTRGTPA